VTISVKQELPGLVSKIMGALVGITRGSLNDDAIAASFEPMTEVEIPSFQEQYA